MFSVGFLFGSVKYSVIWTYPTSSKFAPMTLDHGWWPVFKGYVCCDFLGREDVANLLLKKMLKIMDQSKSSLKVKSLIWWHQPNFLESEGSRLERGKPIAGFPSHGPWVCIFQQHVGTLDDSLLPLSNVWRVNKNTAYCSFHREKVHWIMSITSAHSASLTSVNILLYVLSDDNSIMELTGRTLQTVGVGFKHIQSPNVSNL